ncbi:MAG TPA: hypothetical protein VKQ71_09150, partial [Acidimicrobiales bacterium]|nr:hypothetical protein [Acidimicrobiales bacterium]
MVCEHCGAAIVGDGTCPCEYRRYLLGALSHARDPSSPATAPALTPPVAAGTPAAAPAGTAVAYAPPPSTAPVTPPGLPPGPERVGPFGAPMPVFSLGAPPAGGVGGFSGAAHGPPDRDRRPRRRIVIAVALTVALIVAGGGAAYLRMQSAPSHPSRWDPRLAGVVQFVEKQRGLKFSHPVAVEFMPVAKFKAKMGDGKPPPAQQKADLKNLLGVMRAMGVVHGDADLAAMETQLSQAAIVGLYVPKDKKVYVRGDQLTPDVRVTLAHELTHALQDQHVDLGRYFHLPGADDSALRALVEGDAVVVEDAYAASLSASDKAAYQAARDAESTGADVKGVSQVLIDQAQFPYIFGPVFVKALVANGGTGAIDRALASPPTVDGQILDPNRYLIQQDVPKDKKVYVRGDQLTPDVRVTLAHELTHALQDQHVDLGRYFHLPGADDSALRALVEGDAVVVEDAYVASLSASDKAAYQAALDAESTGADLKGISPVLIDQAQFPYVFGPVFV